MEHLKHLRHLIAAGTPSDVMGLAPERGHKSIQI